MTGPGPPGADRVVYGDRSLRHDYRYQHCGDRDHVHRLPLAFCCSDHAAIVGPSMLAAAHLHFCRQRPHGPVLYSLSTCCILRSRLLTDYIIFLVGRYQEARATGQNREAAYYTMFVDGTRSWHRPHTSPRHAPPRLLPATLLPRIAMRDRRSLRC